MGTKQLHPTRIKMLRSADRADGFVYAAFGKEYDVRGVNVYQGWGVSYAITGDDGGYHIVFKEGTEPVGELVETTVQVVGSSRQPFRGVIVPAYRGSLEICSNCDGAFSSVWYRSIRFNVLVCRVCKYVHDNKVGEGDLNQLGVKDGRPASESQNQGEIEG